MLSTIERMRARGYNLVLDIHENTILAKFTTTVYSLDGMVTNTFLEALGLANSHTATTDSRPIIIGRRDGTWVLSFKRYRYGYGEYSSSGTVVEEVIKQAASKIKPLTVEEIITKARSQHYYLQLESNSSYKFVATFSDGHRSWVCSDNNYETAIRGAYDNIN